MTPQPTTTPDPAEVKNLEMRRLTLGDLPPMPALPDGYTLRQNQPADDDPLAVLLDNSFADVAWTVEKVRADLTRNHEVKATFLIVHEPTDTLVATASVQMFDTKSADGQPAPPQTVGRVHWVATDPTHRGKRLGTIITLATLRDMIERGCTESTLTTQAFRLSAIRIYLALGFVPDERHGAVHDASWAAVLSVLKGSPNSSELG